jgi:hypothetical protein
MAKRKPRKSAARLRREYALLVVVVREGIDSARGLADRLEAFLPKARRAR